jgi:hypothetical protein
VLEDAGVVVRLAVGAVGAALDGGEVGEVLGSASREELGGVAGLCAELLAYQESLEALFATVVAGRNVDVVRAAIAGVGMTAAGLFDRL